MPHTRFRLRTVMIFVAASALLMGAIRLASVVLGVERMFVRVEGSNLCVGFDMEWQQLAGVGCESVLFGRKVYVLIPITSALILTGVSIGLSAVAVFWRTLRARSRAIRYSGIANADGSGEPEEA
jgi:hypothetical protein